ncbi:MAG: SURF1 family protein [Sulfitobacter sp.]
MSRALFFVVIGLGGAAILVSLGIWQVQRLAWKQGVIADINARIIAAPVDLPGNPDPTKDAYLPVTVTGTLGAQALRVLVSQKDVGPGYRMISAMNTGSSVVMVDRGFLPVDATPPQAISDAVTVIGNLQWPQETDKFTPTPDTEKNIWFARDVDAMAAALKTQPILIVAREIAGHSGDVTPLPVDTARIPNDHLQYAITWFSLAVIWLAMSVYFLRRRAPKSES